MPADLESALFDRKEENLRDCDEARCAKFRARTRILSLFASIGEDRGGMEVSVLSGLARSDLDPWLEAAKLAELPGKTAVERLASLIETLPGRVWAQPEARAVATRLVALLPHPHADNASSSQASHSLGAMMNSRPWWVYVVLMSFVLGSQLSQAVSCRRRQIARL
jgi:hypothetical protein